MFRWGRYTRYWTARAGRERVIRMAITQIKAGKAKADDRAKPAPGRENDPAIKALAEAINEAMSPEPKRLAESA